MHQPTGASSGDGPGPGRAMSGASSLLPGASISLDHLAFMGRSTGAPGESTSPPPPGHHSAVRRRSIDAAHNSISIVVGGAPAPAASVPTPAAAAPAPQQDTPLHQADSIRSVPSRAAGSVTHAPGHGHGHADRLGRDSEDEEAAEREVARRARVCARWRSAYATLVKLAQVGFFKEPGAFIEIDLRNADREPLPEVVERKLRRDYRGVTEVQVVDYCLSSARPRLRRWLNDDRAEDGSVPGMVELRAFLQKPRPLLGRGLESQVRWVRCEGLSWDVVKALAICYSLPPLLISDLLAVERSRALGAFAEVRRSWLSPRAGASSLLERDLAAKHVHLPALHCGKTKQGARGTTAHMPPGPAATTAEEPAAGAPALAPAPAAGWGRSRDELAAFLSGVGAGAPQGYQPLDPHRRIKSEYYAYEGVLYVAMSMICMEAKQRLYLGGTGQGAAAAAAPQGAAGAKYASGSGRYGWGWAGATLWRARRRVVGGGGGAGAHDDGVATDVSVASSDSACDSSEGGDGWGESGGGVVGGLRGLYRRCVAAVWGAPVSRLKQVRGQVREAHQHFRYTKRWMEEPLVLLVMRDKSSARWATLVSLFHYSGRSVTYRLWRQITANCDPPPSAQAAGQQQQQQPQTPAAAAAAAAAFASAAGRPAHRPTLPGVGASAFSASVAVTAPAKAKAPGGPDLRRLSLFAGATTATTNNSHQVAAHPPQAANAPAATPAGAAPPAAPTSPGRTLRGADVPGSPGAPMARSSFKGAPTLGRHSWHLGMASSSSYRNLAGVATGPVPSTAISHALVPAVRRGDATYLLYLIMRGVVDQAYDVVKDFSEQLLDFERRVRAGNLSASATEQLHMMTTDLQLLERRFKATSSMVKSLVVRKGTGKSPDTADDDDTSTEWALQLSKGVKEPLRGLADQLTAINDEVASLVVQAADLSNLVFNLIGHRSNDSMQTLSVISTVFLPMTFIAGVYGTNFVWVPELHWELGYMYFWLLNAGIAVTVLLLMRGAGMLGSSQSQSRGAA